MSSVSSTSSSSTTRLSGLVSGMDTDALVKQMLASDQARIDKINGNIQLDDWKIDAYREITSSIQSFYSTYFDPLSSSNLKSENSFSSFTTSYGTTTSSDTTTSSNYVTVTGGATATAGTYTITKLVAATSATLSGGDVSKPVVGAAATDLANISSSDNNNVLVLTLNNVTKQITLDDSGTMTIGDYASNLSSKIDAAFGANKFKVDASSGNLKISTVRPTDSFSIDKAYNDGANELFSEIPTTDSPFTLSESNNKFELTIGAVTKTVTVPQATYNNATDLASAIQSAANTAFGGTADITFSATADGKVTYTSGQTVAVSNTEIDANAALGLVNSTSNKVDLTKNLYDMTNDIGMTYDDTVTNGYDIQFKINGTYFRFNSKVSSLQDIMDTVNSNTSINATMKYNSTTNSFSIKSTGSGVTDTVTVADLTGTLMDTLIGTVKTATGKDASVTLSDGTEIVRSSNSFTYDGLTYNIKQDFTAGTDPVTGEVTDPITATISTDTTKAYDYIKGFVDKYNELIDKVNTKLSEKKYRDYAPLTSEQKAAMSEDQIKQWEDKAKSGLLKNDSTLTGILSKLRSALVDSVEGAGISLSSIGITTTSDYTQKGKLEINESKLKDALATKPEQITKLFTSTSDKTYFDAINSTSSSVRTERYKESGIAQRFSDIIQDAVRTSTDKDGNKGSLLEIAGIVGDRSEYSNTLFKEMESFDDTVTDLNARLTDKENSLYAKFTAMESALEKMNSQQSYITQMLGGS